MPLELQTALLRVIGQRLALFIGISQRKIEENIAKLKAMGILERIGSAKKGEWRTNH